MQARDSIVFVVPHTCLRHWQGSEQYGTTCAGRFLRPSFVEPLDPQSQDAGPNLLSRDTMASGLFRAKIPLRHIPRPHSIFGFFADRCAFLTA